MGSPTSFLSCYRYTRTKGVGFLTRYSLAIVTKLARTPFTTFSPIIGHLLEFIIKITVYKDRCLLP